MITHWQISHQRTASHFGTFQNVDISAAVHGGIVRIDEKIMREAYILDWPQSKISFVIIIVASKIVRNTNSPLPTVAVQASTAKKTDKHTIHSSRSRRIT